MADEKIAKCLDMLTAVVAELIKKDDQKSTQNPEQIIDVLSQAMTIFEFCPDEGLFFDTWYSRYEDLFKEDAKNLTDDAKVRLLLRKLNNSDHEKYVNYILPKKTKDVDFETTVKTLKSIFGRQQSILNARYQCMKLLKTDSEDIIAYSSRVNKCCESFELEKLTKDQFKRLIFVCGLQSSNDIEIRNRMLNLIDSIPDDDTTGLDKLVIEYQRITTLKIDSALIENRSSSSVQVHSVQNNSHKKKSKPFQKSPKDIPPSPCLFCGEMHYMKFCNFKNHQCKSCNTYGHKEGYCNTTKTRQKQQRSEKRPNQHNRQARDRHVKTPHSTLSVYSVNHISATKRRKYISVFLNNTLVVLQIDTGSDITIISKAMWMKIGSPHLLPATEYSKNASGDKMDIESEFDCHVKYDNSTKILKCFVTNIPNLNLFGNDWMDEFNLFDVPINSICNAITVNQPETTKWKAQFPAVFSDNIGKCTKTEIVLHLKPNVKPVFRPKRPVSYATLPKIDAELDRLLKEEIITKVDYSDWATPIVAVQKKDGSVRLCADFSTGLNDALETNHHPLPHPDEILDNLAGSKYFSVLDMKDAYLQVEVANESRHLLTINTHRGLFHYNRLTFGAKPAPAEFQRVMDNMISGLQGVISYLDDLLVFGRSKAEHDSNLSLVLDKIREYGFTLKFEKCKFMVEELRFLGRIINKDGQQPDPKKTDVIAKMPPPSNLSELRSYLGAINYYQKFVPQMHSLRAPLNDLLKQNAKWNWTKQCQNSFDNFKEILCSNLLLTHYDPNQEIVVAADASNSGIGAVISHRFSNGTCKAVQHASRSLTPAESNYSQIEKEGLALVYAITKFHKMVSGRKFTLQTDHKPLLAIFGSKHGIPVYTANRLTRWALILSSYDFKIEHIGTEKFGNADILSRLIDQHTKPDEDFVIASIQLEDDLNQVVNESINNIPVTFDVILKAQTLDSTIKQVVLFMQTNWPSKIPENSASELRFYFNRRSNLQQVNNCLMYGDRIVIPSKFRNRILKQLHRGHPGMDRMTSLARSYVYWPNIDQDIKSFVRSCNNCATAAKSPIKTELSSWPIPDRPWYRVHVDYAGPIDGKMFLVVVDSYTKWPEVVPTISSTATKTIQILKDIFGRYGNPEILVSDNGTQFLSRKMNDFYTTNGIVHLRSPAYHPQSNGQAEVFVGTFKSALKKIGGGNIEDAIQEFLLTYRIIPNKNTINGKSPSELMFGRRIRSNLELLLPQKDAQLTTNDRQNRQFDRHHGAIDKSFDVDDKVWIQVHQNNNWFWSPGIVIEKVGKVLYNVFLEEKRRLTRCHSNQMNKRYNDIEPTIENANDTSTQLRTLFDSFNLFDPIENPVEDQQARIEENIQPQEPVNQAEPAHLNAQPNEVPPMDQQRTRSGRTVRRPEYLRDYDLSG